MEYSNVEYFYYVIESFSIIYVKQRTCSILSIYHYIIILLHESNE